MVRLSITLVAASCSLASGLGSMPYDPSTHVPIKSSGCGKTSPYPLGMTSVVQTTFNSKQWTWRIFVPTSYDPNTPVPFIVQCPGWGVSAQAEEKGAGLTARANALNFISVTPQGQHDNSNRGGPWYSWNTAGSTQSPGQGGPTCTAAANNPSYCYESCTCTDQPQCDWTTCQDGITPTGTGGPSDAEGFLSTLYNTLEDQLCIDTTREFQAGESNGAMMTYQVGVDFATRLAAIFPQFGSFHTGFNLAPSVGLAVVDLHGTQDDTIPANHSLSDEGWYYTITSEIFNGNQYSTGWKQSNNCSGPASHYPTSFDGQFNLYCVLEGNCPGGDVVRCAWNGGHNWYGNAPQYNGGLVTEFLLKWAKPTHVGFGYTQGQSRGPAQIFERVEVVDVQEPPTLEELPTMPKPASPPSTPQFYGNPVHGCREGETALQLSFGQICAPKIGSKPSDNGEPPVPLCRLGGVTKQDDNGCPLYTTDADSKAFPICLGRGSRGVGGYERGEFHCLLMCPCEAGSVSCGPDADKHCPSGAVCRRGELRHGGHGICSFPISEHSSSVVV